jgi:hypothetical protein
MPVYHLPQRTMAASSLETQITTMSFYTLLKFAITFQIGLGLISFFWA